MIEILGPMMEDITTAPLHQVLEISTPELPPKKLHENLGNSDHIHTSNNDLDIVSDSDSNLEEEFLGSTSDLGSDDDITFYLDDSWPNDNPHISAEDEILHNNWKDFYQQKKETRHQWTDANIFSDCFASNKGKHI